MDVLDVIGDFGRFQLEILVLMSIRSVPLAFSALLVLMSAQTVDHFCSPVDPLWYLNNTEWKNCCIPKNDRYASHCQRYGILLNDTVDYERVVECHEWTYDETGTSVISEWDLVCDRKWIVTLMHLTFNLGNLLSYPATGYFTDRYGRRPAILLGLTGLLVANGASYFSTSLTWFLVFRFICGLAYSPFQCVTVTIYTEVVGKKMRGLTSICTGVAWNVGKILLFGASTLFKKWRILALIGSFPNLPLLLLYWKFLPESPRWLLVQKDRERAKEVLLKATKKNGIVIEDVDNVLAELEKKAQKTCEEQMSAGMKDFFTDRKLFCISCLLVLSSFVNYFNDFGFYISLHSFGSSFSTTFVISACLYLFISAMNATALSLLKRRRYFLICTYGLTGMFYLAATAVSEEMRVLRMALPILGCMINEMSLQTVLILGNEVFPTPMRSRGNTVCMMAGRVGNLLASFTDLLRQKHGVDACYYLFASLDLIVAIGYAFFPHMESNCVPDTIPEVKSRVSLRQKQGGMCQNYSQVHNCSLQCDNCQRHEAS